MEDDKECDDEHSKDKPREEEEVSEREEEGISYETEKSTDGTEKKMKRKGRCPITGIYVPPGGLRRVLV